MATNDVSITNDIFDDVTNDDSRTAVAALQTSS